MSQKPMLDASTSISERLRRILQQAPPAFTPDEAAAVAREQFGVEGALTPLASERDQNFRLAASDGRALVLKFANQLESRDVLAFQTEALRSIAASDPGLPVPRVCLGRAGAAIAVARSAAGVHLVRLLTFLPGTPAIDRPRTAALRRAIGRLAGRLGWALSSFSHPADDHPLIWDMKQAAGIRPLCEAVPGRERRRLLARHFDRFADAILPRMMQLRTQVIHHDLNPNNIILDPARPGEITGIIDFGDMVRSPLIADLAVAAAHQIYDQADPVAAAADLVAGYHAERPLETAELELLPALIATRYATRIAISAWRLAAFPEGSRYDPAINEMAWSTLERLASLDPVAVARRLREACP
jgi:Ser/Thr protein kinase RdoA (MazF antagonist)